MKYSVDVTSYFEKRAKPLLKKYPSLKNELLALVNELETSPKLGTPIGKDVYKIRLAIQSKGKGKSGGARIITCVKIISSKVYLVDIFDKSDQENIADKDLQLLINKLV